MYFKRKGIAALIATTTLLTAGTVYAVSIDANSGMTRTQGFATTDTLDGSKAYLQQKVAVFMDGRSIAESPFPDYVYSNTSTTSVSYTGASGTHNYQASGSHYVQGQPMSTSTSPVYTFTN